MWVPVDGGRHNLTFNISTLQRGPQRFNVSTFEHVKVCFRMRGHRRCSGCRTDTLTLFSGHVCADEGTAPLYRLQNRSGLRVSYKARSGQAAGQLYSLDPWEEAPLAVTPSRSSVILPQTQQQVKQIHVR